MPFLDVVLLGILEGLTEFLPVSSTGHLILLGQVLGHDSEADKTLEIVIQLGAVVAVILYYARKRLLGLVRGLLSKDPVESLPPRPLARRRVHAGGGDRRKLAIRKWIKAHLFGPIPVVREP